MPIASRLLGWSQRRRELGLNATLHARSNAHRGSAADARRYNRVFAAVALPPILLMAAVALTQEPLRGDLTRPGGYAESEYGWNQPQERFSPPLVSTTYDRPFDVVVFGDSFSLNPGGQSDPGVYWTNYLAQRTGFAVVVLTRFDVTLEELLRHPVYVRSPPRLLILENVERYLIRDFVIESDKRIGRFKRTCQPVGADVPHLPAFRPTRAATIEWTRDTAPELNFDQATDFLWKSAAREIFGIDITRIVRLQLTRSDLFSSRAADQLLVYDDEIRKREFTTQEALESAYCTLIDVQNRVESNGHTRFLFMSAPDKATAYADYLAAPELRALSRLPAFAERSGLRQIMLLDPIRRAIRAGAKDVYMPNDTHWSSTGHRIVGDTVVKAIAGRSGSSHP